MRLTLKKLSIVQVIFLLHNAFSVRHVVMEIACIHFVMGLEFTVSFLLIVLVDMSQKRGVLIEVICFEGFNFLLGQKFILE